MPGVRLDALAVEIRKKRGEGLVGWKSFGTRGEGVPAHCFLRQGIDESGGFPLAGICCAVMKSLIP